MPPAVAVAAVVARVLEYEVSHAGNQHRWRSSHSRAACQHLANLTRDQISSRPRQPWVGELLAARSGALRASKAAQPTPRELVMACEQRLPRVLSSDEHTNDQAHATSNKRLHACTQVRNNKGNSERIQTRLSSPPRHQMRESARIELAQERTRPLGVMSCEYVAQSKCCAQHSAGSPHGARRAARAPRRRQHGRAQQQVETPLVAADRASARRRSHSLPSSSKRHRQLPPLRIEARPTPRSARPR